MLSLELCSEVRDLSVKRMLDLALAGTALLVSAPLFTIAAVAIKLDSRGPVLFRQTRVGRDRRPIETLKLRTMTAGADRAGSHLTAHRDARVTRVGHWLRRTKLDELPQLWNVVRGDMSLVGPRPEVPRFVATYRPEWEALFSVKPGITDLASIAFRDEEQVLAGARDHERAYREVVMPLKLALALEGVRESSVRYDLGILARTALAILRGPSREHRELLAEARRRIDALGREVERA
jgi:lipopolysaccharide/colanic/teichoic acid biosynthesis glycosyltransferase